MKVDSWENNQTKWGNCRLPDLIDMICIDSSGQIRSDFEPTGFGTPADKPLD